MRRSAVLIGLVLGIAIAVAATAFGIASAAHAAETVPARLFVSAKEYSLIESRQTLQPGKVHIQLYNSGEDAHNLVLQRVGGTRRLAIGKTRPGEVTELSADLRSGTWKLWCSLPGHRAAGMRATLVVRR